MPNNSTPESAAPTPDEARLLIQLHCTEYQSLTARIAQQTTQQYWVLGAMVAYITLASSVLTRSNPPFPFHRWLLWGTVFVVQIITAFWFRWQIEILHTLLYIRDKLRKAAAELVPRGNFWRDETYSNSVSDRSAFWQLAPVLPPCVAFGLAIYSVHYGFCQNTGNQMGLLLNVPVFLVIARKCYRVLTIVRRLKCYPWRAGMRCTIKKEKAVEISLNGLLFMPATTYAPTHLARAVPSAQRGLTSVFGMGTGGSPAVRSPTSRGA